MDSKKVISVKFPAPVGAEVKCPICDGNKCIACDWSGKLSITVDAKVPIQRAHIVKYVVDNLQTMAQEITKKYGMTPQINTKEVIKINDGQYEIVQISSIGGACWIDNRIDEYAPPQYFTNYQELTKFCGGMEI